MQVAPSGKGGAEEDEVLTHPRRQPIGEHLFPRAGHLENAADLALSLGLGSILQNPPTSCSLQRGKSKRQESRELDLGTERTPCAGDALVGPCLSGHKPLGILHASSPWH